MKLNRQQKYAASSEKMEHSGQISFFDEAESVIAENPIIPEPTEETIVIKKKKRGSNFDNLPVETIEYILEDRKCPNCNEELHNMKKEVRKELKFVPAKISIVEHITYIYACRNCENTGISGTIIRANSPKALVEKSFVSPSLMANIMNEKYSKAMPLDRQEKEFMRQGINISKQNLSNWIIKGAQLLEPLKNNLKSELVKDDILHADETVLEVLCEPGRDAETNSYMWVYRTSGNTEKNVVLYDYTETRTGKYPKEYLKDFHGYLHTDGYAGYHQLEPQITLLGCWAHLRRKFHDAFKLLDKNSSQDNLENKALALIGEIFKIEEDISSKSPKEKYDARNLKSKVKVAEFYDFVDKYQGVTLPKSPLGKAFTYAINQKKFMVRFLENGKAEISNNRVERSIKPFVIGRKNWLFSNTPSGAKSSAIIYSIIETAKENNLKPQRYLEYIFEQIQQNVKSDNSILLPWCKTLPDDLRLK